MPLNPTADFTRCSGPIARREFLRLGVARVRTLALTGFCHQQGNQQVMTGHPEVVLKLRPDHPDIMSVAHYVRYDPLRSMPSYVALNPIPYVGAAYLGPGHEAFKVMADPNKPSF